MTFPLVARSRVGQDAEIRAKVARLYGANTLGAALGAFAATFMLMPERTTRPFRSTKSP